jgi:tetratricopeptide (TPR) repeat protein
MTNATPLATALLAALSLGAHAQTESSTEASRVFKKNSPSIVVVRTARANGGQHKQGSGVVVAKNLVATNCHVIDGASSISVGVASGAAPGVLIRGDAGKDICLVSVSTGAMPIVDIRPSKTMTIGEAVYAIGWPKGLELTLSSGLVSQLRGGDSPMIQTTAAISPGSSGGGLFDAKGKLVGITTFKVDGGESLNFAKPADWIGTLPPITVQRIAQETRAERESAIKQLMNANQFKEVIAKSQEWADDDPDYFRPHWAMGLAFSMMRLYEQSVAEYQKAIDIKPDQQDAWRLKGAALAGMQKNSEAVEALKEAVRLDPADAKGWDLLSHTYNVMNRPNDSLTAAYKALDAKETDVYYRWVVHLFTFMGFTKVTPEIARPGDFKPEHVAYASDIPLEAVRRAAKLNPKNPENMTSLLASLYYKSLCTEFASVYSEFRSINEPAALTYAGKLRDARPVKCPQPQ